MFHHRIDARFTRTLAVLLIAGIAGICSADWDPGGPHKMHHPQLPDLTPNGIDVNTTAISPFLLADDFRCTQSGPITNIHVWGSWLSDFVDDTAAFTLSIHADVTKQQNGGEFSRPGELLWEQVFTVGSYARRLYSVGQEGWMNPPDQYQPDGDTQCYQYNFPIPEAQQFVQASGTVYWLDVQYTSFSPIHQFGWKTCELESRWNDNAVWQPNTEPAVTNAWLPLTYPAGHTNVGEQLDLAFVIDGAPLPADPFDYGDAPDPLYPTLLANNGARHSPSASGPLMGLTWDFEPDGQPTAAADGDDTGGTDDEDGVTFMGPLAAGMPFAINVDMSVSPAPGFFSGWIDFNADGDWSDAGEQVFADAWLTTGTTHSVTGAVPARALKGPTMARFRISSLQRLSYDGPASDGEVEDYAVTVADGVEHKMHYPQWPDPHGWDVNGTEPMLLADDFLCTSNGYITRVTFWGSWFDDLVGEILNVHLSIHSDDRSGPYSKPGELLWERDTPTVVMVPEEPSDQGWLEPGTDNWSHPNHSNYFRYRIDIPEENAFVQTNGTIYWLDIRVATDRGTWGWKTSGEEPFEDDAVWWEPDPTGGPGEWRELIDPITSNSLDLAFIIDGDPVPEEDLSDFGDAPDPTYPTLLASGGASHLLVAGAPFMGAAVDGETDGQPDAVAQGDDNAATDDEDGVQLITPLTPGSTFTVRVDMVASPAPGFFSGWIDFNRDGDWADSGEQVFADAPLTPGSVHTLTGLTAAGALGGTSYARYRISSSQGLSYDRAAPDGEVEDYQVILDGEFPHKMHYPQWPDPHGWDVMATEPSIMADDFLCTEDGLIERVTFWGSWFNNEQGQVTNVHLSIHSDDRSGPYSKPGKLLWQWDTPAFFIQPEAPSLQGWHDPVEGLMDPSNHVDYARYTIDIPRESAFVQTNGTIYWLDISVSAVGGLWGWKTSGEAPFEDDATWWDWSRIPSVWRELIDPIESNSLDLAFIIDGSPVEEDSLDYGDAPRPYPTLQASTGASHVVVGPWLGLRQSNDTDAETNGQPDPNALGDDQDGYDDELGVSFTEFVHGLPTTYTVHVNSPGGAGAASQVEIWLDLNGDGSWSASELILNTALSTGTYTPSFNCPTGSVAGSTFARCRISTSGTGAPTGAAPDGEVEDHNVFLDNGYITWGNLQWPPAITTTVTVATPLIYGQAYQAGLTDSPGAAPGLQVELGVGPDGTTPVGNPSWTWVPAVYNSTPGSGVPANNDEYQQDLTINFPGTYDYAYRYSRNGIEWTYGDLDGSANGYQVAQAGNLVVQPWPQCPKWSQPPDCEIGVDLQSHGPDRDGLPPQFQIADDWLCDGRPVTAVRWWGSYIGYHDDPVPAPTNERPRGFVLTWYEDIPAGTGEIPYSRPGAELTNVIIQLQPYGNTQPVPGTAIEQYYCTSDIGWMEPAPPSLGGATNEHEYEYLAVLPEAWNEKEGNIYWLGVRAMYAQEQRVSHVWGWKTTAPENNWNDDAAIVQAPVSAWVDLEYPPNVSPWTDVENWPYAGESVNMAFELMTDVCPRRAKKWCQPPDMINGMDAASHAPSGRVWQAAWPLRAEDFVSDGRLITDIHWWGSYIGWQSRTNQPPAPPSGTSESLLGFEIAWHADVPTNAAQGFSMPTNPPLRRLYVPIDMCHEMYYGSIYQDWIGLYEHEFQYYVDLMDPRIRDPWPEQQDGIYWLSIQAVFPSAWNPDQGGTHFGWGWLSTNPSNNWNDISVVSTNTMSGWPVWKPGAYKPASHPWALTNADLNLAFELTTMDVGSSPWHKPIWIRDIIDLGNGQHDLPSIGDLGSGMQVLQATTMITNSNSWADVSTNLLPLPPPYTNWWFRDAGTTTGEFYRILQR